MTDDAALVVIGTVTRPHGLTGEVRVRFYSDDPGKYAGFDRFMIQVNGKTDSLKVEGVRRHQDVFLFRFCGYGDRTAADRLRGTDLYIPREELGEPGEDEYFFTDLEGLSVLVSETGEPFGKVDLVFDSGANAVLTVGYEEDGRERQVNVPFIRDAVETVSLDEGHIKVKEMFLRV